MKEDFELVKKLVAETGVSYTEAKAVLEKTEWDILDAIIELEAQGKTAGASSYSTRLESEKTVEEGSRKKDESKRKREESKKKKEDYKERTVGVMEWLVSVLDKGNANSIEMYRNGERKIGLPVTVFVILLILSCSTILVLMLISLFFGCRYRFTGPDLERDDVNSVMGKATDCAENIKKEFKNMGNKEDKES